MTLSPKWKPGQSGNPAGKPKGSRTKLSEAFLRDLHADWLENGVNVIERVRGEKPDVYLRVVASMLPQKLEIERPLQGLSDNELADLIGHVRSLVAGTIHAAAGAGAGGSGEGGSEPPGDVPAVH